MIEVPVLGEADGTRNGGDLRMSVLAFGDEGCIEVALTGGKGASLARMTALGLPVPPGFVVPADCLAAALPDGGAELRAALADAGDDSRLAAAAARARSIVETCRPAADLIDDIVAHYAGLGADDPPVAVRSSACSEDSETASFAGQQETYLHVRGAADVVARIRDCWASFFTERALFYRARKGSLDDLGMAVVVQRMVRADVAGVLFTIDTVHRRRDRMVVEAAFGLGEAVVSGEVTPDQYVLKRDGTIRKQHVCVQPIAIVARPEGGTEERKLTPEEGGAVTLDQATLRELARIGADLEQRLERPQDIEWAIEDGQIFVLQARPVTA
jgi:pyruvate,water dikinase